MYSLMTSIRCVYLSVCLSAVECMHAIVYMCVCACVCVHAYVRVWETKHAKT